MECNIATEDNKIAIFRHLRGWKIEYVAKKLMINIEDYKMLECGDLKVNNSIAKKLSILYNIPKKYFYKSNNLKSKIIFDRCNFNNSNGYIHNVKNQKIVDNKYFELIIISKDAIIKTLENQVEHLRLQNDKLLAIILKQV